MYEILNSISRLLSNPIVTLMYESKQIPLLASFSLGIIGALAPCQLTGNISAIIYYGNKSLQTKKQWNEAFLFIIGKIVVFSLLGLAVWMLGREFETFITGFFAFFRKAIGPLIIFLGLFLFGVFKLHWINRLYSINPRIQNSGKWGSFLMGVSFSIAFCPTMFFLFFLTLNFELRDYSSERVLNWYFPSPFYSYDNDLVTRGKWVIIKKSRKLGTSI